MIATQYKPSQTLPHALRLPFEWHTIHHLKQQYTTHITPHSGISAAMVQPESPPSSRMTVSSPVCCPVVGHDGLESSLPSIPDPLVILEQHSSEDEVITDMSTHGSNDSRSSLHKSTNGPQTVHVIQLSSIEHCMPRAYIRICLAYKVPSIEHRSVATRQLQSYVKKLIAAKPYLAGRVVNVKKPGTSSGRAEVRFTRDDCMSYSGVEVVDLVDGDGKHVQYADLDEQGLPPSRLRPEDVSALQPNVDPLVEAPVFQVRANFVEGGLIVSFYLHHCISDGTGFDLITSGDLLNDRFTFGGPDPQGVSNAAEIDRNMDAFAEAKTRVRQRLSTAPSGTVNTRQLQARQLDAPAMPTNMPGRGCVLMITAGKIHSLRQKFNTDEAFASCHIHTTNSLVMALLWRHMTRARRPTVAANVEVRRSKLLVPVDIRNRLAEALPDGYFGAAIDSAKVELDLDTLTDSKAMGLHEVSHAIRQGVANVNDDWVRQGIHFANTANDNTDVADIQASNMDRVTGADMYITSWLTLRTYQHDLGMGLGGPDWVRKPWSRDPGSCIILPQKSVMPDFYEVVVQMTEADMGRLLNDEEFMEYVERVID